MSLQGWELLDTESVTQGAGFSNAGIGVSSTDTKVFYIFYKEVTDSVLQETVKHCYKK
jgi:hypothetical protein